MKAECRDCKKAFDYEPFSYSKNPVHMEQHKPVCARCRQKHSREYRIREAMVNSGRKRRAQKSKSR